MSNDQSKRGSAAVRSGVMRSTVVACVVVVVLIIALQAGGMMLNTKVFLAGDQGIWLVPFVLGMIMGMH